MYLKSNKKIKRTRAKSQFALKVYFIKSTILDIAWNLCDFHKLLGCYNQLVINPFFCHFRVKEYYLIWLRSVQIRIFCLWLKYAFFENSKLYSRSNGTEGNFKPRKYLLLNSVLALLSVTFFRRTRQVAEQSQEVHLVEYRS